MPNDLPDWTGQQLVQLISEGGSFLGDTGAAVPAADSGAETIATTSGVSSSTALIESFLATGTPAIIQAGPVQTGTTGAVQAFGAPPGVGHLLLAAVTAYGADPTTLQAGWAQVGPSSNPGGGGTHLAFWAKPNSAGNDPLPNFTGGAGPGLMQCALLEFSGIALANPLDKAGGLFQGTTATTITATAAGVDAGAGDLVVLGVGWRNGATPFTATFSDVLNNGAVATRATDNGAQSRNDHLSVSWAVIPPAKVSLPLGVRPWIYDASGNHAPAQGTIASVVLAATPGKAYRAHTLIATVTTTAAATGITDAQLLDGAAVLHTEGISVPAVAGSLDRIELVGVAFPGTVGNSMTWKILAVNANLSERVTIGAYLQ